MNDLYAVDPAAPAGSSELITLLSKFGPTEGRFIVKFPEQWVVAVREALASESEISRARALSWLHRRRHAVIARNLPRSDSKTWAEGAAHLPGLKARIAGRGCPPTCLPIDDALYSPDALPDSRGALIPRTVKAYVDAAWPIFVVSPKVVLVDPYLKLTFIDRRGRPRFDRRYRDVVSALINEAIRHRRTEVFRLYVSRAVAMSGEADPEAFKTELMRVVTDTNATRPSLDLELEVGIIEEDLPDKQHARYLLGTGCGLHFDYGFDTSDDGSMNHVTWLGEAVLRPLLERFDLREV